MSALDTVAGGLKSVSAMLSTSALEPDRSRADWAEHQAQLEAMETALDTQVLALLEGALHELSDDEHRKFRDLVALLVGSCAAVQAAAGREGKAQALLRHAAALAGSASARIRLEASASQLPWHVELAHAEWLARGGHRKPARAILERVLEEAPDGPLKAEAREVLDVPQDELMPIQSAPPLFRVNGCGVGLYGHRDDARDGTYVSTLCLCLVFIPVFPLIAYRVRDQGDGWVFYGKTALSPFARWFRRLLALGAVAAVVGVQVQAHLDSPDYAARQVLAQAAAAERAGHPEQALELYDGALRDYLGRAEGDTLAPAAEGQLRLRLAAVKEPFALEQVDAAERLGHRLAELGPGAWKRGAEAALVAKLRGWADQLGAQSPGRAEASLRLLEVAGPLAAASERPQLEAQVVALRKGLARALREFWPLEAFGHYARVLGDAEAVAEAGAILEALGEAPSVYPENERPLRQWLAAARGAAPQRALAATVQDRLDAALAQQKAQGRDELLGSDDVARLKADQQRFPRDQEVAVRLASLYRAKGDSPRALATLEAQGTPGLLVGDALLLLASLKLELGKQDEGRALLAAYVGRWLPQFQEARRGLQHEAEGAQDRLVADARAGRLPADLRARLDGAKGDQEAQALFGEYLREELGKDPRVAEARERYARLHGVVSASLLLGTLELAQANASKGAERTARLASAERRFAAVRQEAEGTTEYQLGYGQVLHRLGRPAEGDQQLEAAMAGGEPAVKLRVAQAYRELGLVKRARELLTDVWAHAGLAQKDQAAAMMAAMGDTLDDKELWLSRVATSSPLLQAERADVRGQRLLTQGKLAEAEREFVKVADYYSKLASSSGASANNAALAWGARYECSGNPAHLDQAVTLLRQGARLEPDNAILLGNVAALVEHRAGLAVLEQWVHTRALRPNSGETMALLELLTEGPLAAEARAAVSHEPLRREVVELSQKQEVLAPARTEGVEREWRWLSLERDEAGRKALLERLERGAHFDTSEDLAGAERWEKGSEDDTLRSSVKARLAALEPLTKDAHGPTRAAALALKCSLAWRLSQVDAAAAPAREAAVACRQAEAAWPGLGAKRMLGSVLLSAAVLGAGQGSPALQQRWRDEARKTDGLAFALRAAEAPGVADLLAKQPELAAAAALVREGTGERELSDWVIARLAHDEALAAQLAPQLRTERNAVGRRFAALVSGQTPRAKSHEALWRTVAGEP